MKIPNWRHRSAWEKEWDALCKKEQRFLADRQTKKETALNRLLEEKVPDKLQQTLDGTFEKAFILVFEKGTGVIEKTYNKEALEQNYQVNAYTNKVCGERRSLRTFSKKANKVGNINLVFSGISGVGMGLLGIGLPDILFFTGMILKCIYEIALNYGFDYTSVEEKYFILLLVEGAVSYGEHFTAVDNQIETYLHNSQLPQNYSTAEQVGSASRMLSRELLYMKFLQGIPVVGAVGGAYDVVYMKQISTYARLKYHKRFLLSNTVKHT